VSRTSSAQPAAVWAPTTVWAQPVPWAPPVAWVALVLLEAAAAQRPSIQQVQEHVAPA
jgi:hypothetical protein